MTRRTQRRAVAALAAITLLGAAGAAAAKTVISMSGSTSVYPLAAKLAGAYVRSHSVGFRIFQGGSDIGINDVAHGRVSIGDSSRDPEKNVDPHGLVFHKIARDGVCLITNSANPISNLSQAQVQAIYSGSISSWSQVPGSRQTGAIKLFTRTAASGTADAFTNIFMYPYSIAGSAVPESSNGLVQSHVHSDPGAIGFVSFAFTGGVHAVPYKGVPCSLRNAKDGQYGGVRNFWMVTRGAAKGATAKFLTWVQHSSAARSIISSDWVPLG
jgi:phosphate transport system substrate-binding protein